MAEALVYKCPNCGARIDYDGKADKMVCEYCDSEINVEAFKNLGQEGDKTGQFNIPGDEKRMSEDESDEYIVHTCPTCGGQLITDENTAATTCVYCGNPAMIKERLTGVYRPEIVVPFKMSKEDAKNALRKLYEKKPLLPKTFKDENRIKNVSGVYIPFWLFDCDTDSDMTFKAMRVTTWSDSRYRYTKTDHYRLFRSGTMEFRNVPADGSKKTDDTLMESIEPFDISKAVPFDSAYLAGFSADKYDEEPKDLRDRVNQRIVSSVDSVFRRTIAGYSGIMREGSNIKYSGDNVRYALFPVWMLNSIYKDKKYSFVMNGESGRSAGELPIDKKRMFAYFAAVAGGVWALLFVIFFLIL